MQYPTIDQCIGNTRMVKLQRIPGATPIPFWQN